MPMRYFGRGVNKVYRETLGSALDLSIDALQELGMDERRARRVAEIFREHDEASVREMAHLPQDEMIMSPWRANTSRTSSAPCNPTWRWKPRQTMAVRQSRRPPFLRRPSAGRKARSTRLVSEPISPLPMVRPSNLVTPASSPIVPVQNISSAP